MLFHGPHLSLCGPHYTGNQKAAAQDAVRPSVLYRLESIMLQNLPIMLFGISQIFCPLCLFVCFSEMHYVFILCFFFVQRNSYYDTV